MTKEVIISIKGMQFDTSGEEPLEMITAGYYFNKNEKHYVIYDETAPQTGEETKNTIKISENRIDVIKKGSASVHMVFEPNKKNMTYYNTPYGELLVGINTLGIKWAQSELNIDVDIDYALEINYSHVSDCNISINIKSKEDKDFKLH